jgi:hypothetical protein
MIVTVKEEDQLPKKINYQRRRWSMIDSMNLVAVVL